MIVLRNIQEYMDGCVEPVEILVAHLRQGLNLQWQKKNYNYCVILISIKLGFIRELWLVDLNHSRFLIQEGPKVFFSLRSRGTEV